MSVASNTVKRVAPAAVWDEIEKELDDYERQLFAVMSGKVEKADVSAVPRDDHGRWTGGGASHPDPVQYEFVSPNVASNLDFKGAVKAIDGEQQAAMHEASQHINEALGIKAEERDIVGAWTDGAENSVMDIVKGGDWEKLVVSGAMKGYIAYQKQVLVFQQEDEGHAAMYHFDAKGSLDDIHKGLLEDGVQQHSLVPTKDGATVYALDLDGSAGDAIEKGAARYDAQIEVQLGRAQFIGTDQQDGTDVEQRNSARASYEDVIGKSSVQGAKDVWRRVRDTWGQGLGGSRPAFA